MIRLFVGCAAWADAESQAVLEYTARSLSSLPIEIVWMSQARKGFWSGWNTAGWKSPFTGFRWGIPAYCKYEGKAIYTDSDFIFRADLAELWNQPIPGALLLNSTEGKLATSAILFDCAKCQAFVPPIEALKKAVGQDRVVRDYLRHHREVIGAFEGDWNAIDLKRHKDIADPRIKAIHYSRMETQPHLKYAVARLAAAGQRHWYTGITGPHWRPDLIALFDALLPEAAAAGYPVERYATGEAQVFARSNFVYSHSKVAS